MIPQSVNAVLSQAKCLHSRSDVDQALDRMAFEITGQLGGKNPLLLCVMIGGLVPTGNLLPRLNFPLELDYVHATRYKGETSGGELEWRARPATPLKGRTVLIIDDILDRGNTLTSIADYCRAEEAEEIYTAVLVDKAYPRPEDVIQRADFTGLQIEDRYVFGYGLDYKEYLRNAPGIYAVAEEHV